MSADLGLPIASGRTAEVYAWGEGQVLKLFHPWFEPEDVEHEARIARAVYDTGLPAPAVGEMIRLDRRLGLVYQRVEGATMWSDLFKRPWQVLHHAQRLAHLHAEMHASPAQADLPSQRRRLIEKINRTQALPEHLRSRVLAILESLPDGESLCHGDFHPGNVLLTRQGEVIIDWIDAARGNPLADLARTTILALGAAACQIQGVAPRLMVRLLHAAYLRRYFRLRPGGQVEHRRWLPVVAAARLSEDIPELRAWLVARVERGLPEG